MFEIKSQYRNNPNGGLLENVGDGETFIVPIGAMILMEAVVIVNNKFKARILDSNWVVSGNQLVRGKFCQSLDEAKGSLAYGRDVTGGYNGNPAVIETGWVDNNEQQNITIRGRFEFNGYISSFLINGKVKVKRPTFTLPTKKPNFVTPIKIDDESIMGEYLVTTTISLSNIYYECRDNCLIGGEIGILQTVRGNRYRIGTCVDEIKGLNSSNGVLDISENDTLFYDKQIAIPTGEIKFYDNPQEILYPHSELFCKGKQNLFLQYKIGNFRDQTGNNCEFFETFVAYKAPITESVTQTIIVVKSFFNWFWYSNVLKDEEEVWRLDDSIENTSKFVESGWDIPSWEDCILNVDKWKKL